ncbi:MAG: TIGR00730 family Rossman fold protein [Desulfosarcinaceae bacterium]|nr:TIGR00730 family Rossman fold protein [Desulfosarcinaceae bacterium]
MAHRLDRICVFCGSSPGRDPAYVAAARQLGRTLAREGIGLVYGGGNVGMMGEVANAAVAAGGRVTGVIPKALMEREVALTNLEDLRVVDSMHSRKALMADLSDGFIALPGGIGTLEEIIEVLTWAQLGLHEKPCALLNTAGYFETLLKFLDEIAAARFMAAEHRHLVLTEREPAALLAAMRAFTPPVFDKATWAKHLNGR